MKSLSGKTVIVTGGASGQGAAEARLFAGAGAKVVLTDINPAGAQFAKTLGGDAIFIAHDVADEASWAVVIEQTLARFGGLDILVNNAAVAKNAPLLATPVEELDRHYRVNMRGVFLGMRAAADVMIKAGGGTIINISSLAGMSYPPGAFAYSASKWGVRGMTGIAAVELASFGIRVNGVYPGLIDTPMIDTNTPEQIEGIRQMLPMKRLGTPQEVANVVLFLSSDEASYVSGAEIKVGGGA